MDTDRQTPAIAQIRLTFGELLADRPPYTTAICDDAVVVRDRYVGIRVAEPQLLLWCDSEVCQRFMLFESAERNDVTVYKEQLNLKYLQYRCKHCEHRTKIYSILLAASNGGGWGVTKLGEWPPYGPHLPNRVLKMVQAEVAFMKLGRRAESLNLGIGAFAYYRRVVERQKDALFDQIIAVAKKVGARRDMLDALEAAKSDFHFTKSIEAFKAAIPETLLINGQNPLALLHKALSAGMHNDSDEECMVLAHDIRMVLTELSERCAAVLRDQSELDQAVSRLIQRK